MLHVANGPFGDPYSHGVRSSTDLYNARRAPPAETPIPSPVVLLDGVVKDSQVSQHGAIFWDDGRVAHLLGR